MLHYTTFSYECKAISYFIALFTLPFAPANKVMTSHEIRKLQKRKFLKVKRKCQCEHEHYLAKSVTSKEKGLQWVMAFYMAEQSYRPSCIAVA